MMKSPRRDVRGQKRPHAKWPGIISQPMKAQCCMAAISLANSHPHHSGRIQNKFARDRWLADQSGQRSSDDRDSRGELTANIKYLGDWRARGKGNPSASSSAPRGRTPSSLLCALETRSNICRLIPAPRYLTVNANALVRTAGNSSSQHPDTRSGKNTATVFKAPVSEAPRSPWPGQRRPACASPLGYWA